MFATLWKGDVHRTYDNPPMRLGSYVFADDFDGPQLFRMCMCTETDGIDYGEVVRDAALILSSASTTAVASAAGTNLLNDTGVFTSAESVYLGAFGKIIDVRTNGGGQGFYVTKKISDDALEIFCYCGEVTDNTHTRIEDGNWGIAIAEGAPYDLYKPGRVRLGSTNLPAVGVCQVKGTTKPMVANNKYFFAKCSGLAECVGDTSVQDFRLQQQVTTAASGLVAGIATTVAPTDAETSGYIGVCQHADLTEDQLITVELDLRTGGASQHFPRSRHPLNANTI